MYNDDIAQVSMNLLDFSTTGLHSVTEAIRNEAAEMELEITAGELVGLVPLDAILDAGRHYNKDDSVTDARFLVDLAISKLKLDVLDDFNPDERIIEWAAKVI